MPTSLSPCPRLIMVETLQDQLSCPICIEICSDAVETNCCSQLICENCSLGLRTCPICRAEPLGVTINKSVRRMIGSMPATCSCGYSTTRADLKAHEMVCPMKPATCTVKNCEFTGCREAFLKHVAEQHSKEVIAYFSTPQQEMPKSAPIRDCIGKIGNARIGASGKYYCGQRLNVNCSCCNGLCGPGDGCNCQSCMLLDIAARALPKGFLVNREGRTARAGSDNMWHCGAKVMRGVPGCDGWCGPTNGPQCLACQRLQAQLSTRYNSIVASWTRP
jgi:hypothetical protein